MCIKQSFLTPLKYLALCLPFYLLISLQQVSWSRSSRGCCAPESSCPGRPSTSFWSLNSVAYLLKGVLVWSPPPSVPTLLHVARSDRNPCFQPVVFHLMPFVRRIFIFPPFGLRVFGVWIYLERRSYLQKSCLKLSAVYLPSAHSPWLV